MDESYAGECCKLLECVISACKEKAMDIYPTWIEMVIERLKVAEAPALKVLLIEVILNIMMIDPLATLQLLTKIDIVDAFVNLWIEIMPEFVRLHDKHLAVLAFCQFYRINFADLPASVQSLYKDIFVGTMSTLVAWHKQRKDLDEREEEDDEDEDYDDDFDLEDIHLPSGEEEEEFDQEPGGDAAVDPTEERLFDEYKQLRNAENEYGDDEDVKDKLEEMGDKIAEFFAQRSYKLRDDEYIEYLIDELNPLYYFEETMTFLQQQEEVMQHLRSVLSPAEWNLYNELEKLTSEERELARNEQE